MKPQDMGLSLSLVKNWRANVAFSQLQALILVNLLYFFLLWQMVFVKNTQATVWSTDNSGAKLEARGPELWSLTLLFSEKTQFTDGKIWRRHD